MPLFERRHRQVLLTDAGRRLMEVTGRAFDDIDLGVRRLRTTPRHKSLVVAVDPDFAGLWLVPRLAAFRSAVPNVAIEIAASKELVELPGHRIDCAVHYGRAHYGRDPWPGVHAEQLFRSTLFPVCHPTLARGDPPVRSADDLRHHTLLHDRSTDEWCHFITLSGAQAVDCFSGLLFSETTFSFDAATRGQGVAIGDDFLCAMHLIEERLFCPFGPGFPSPNAYFFLSPKDTLSAPRVKAFRMWLLETLAHERRRINDYLPVTVR